MGIIRNGILGSISGSVGPVVLCTYRTQEVVKSKPKKSSKPAVQSQVDQRSKFRLATEFLSYFSDVINYGYRSAAQITTPMNRAVTYLLDNAITGVSPNFKLDYSKIKLTSVKTAITFETQVVVAAGRKLSLTWGASEELDANLKALRDTDTAVIVFYGENTDMYLDVSGTPRGDGKADFKFPSMFGTDTVHGWMHFLSKDKKTVFRGAYLGEFKLIA